jgi:hypothetical protein
MENQNPLDELLNKIEDILRMVQENPPQTLSEEDIPHGIEERLAKIEKDVAEFRQLAEEIVTQSGVSKAEMRKRSESIPKDATDVEKRFLTKIGKMKKDAELTEQELAEKLAKSESHPHRKTGSEKSQKKFRRTSSHDKV